MALHNLSYYKNEKYCYFHGSLYCLKWPLSYSGVRIIIWNNNKFGNIWKHVTLTKICRNSPVASLYILHRYHTKTYKVYHHKILFFFKISKIISSVNLRVSNKYFKCIIIIILTHVYSWRYYFIVKENFESFSGLSRKFLNVNRLLKRVYL